MSTIFWKKSFPLCFSISKCLPTTQSSPNDRDNTQTTSSSSSSSMPIKAFNSSVYEIFAASSNSDDFFSSSDELCDSEILPPAPAFDLATVYASPRFFFSSPGQSNSIIESSTITSDHASKPLRPVATAKRNTTATQFAGGVEVPKYSVDPFVDFRRSMQEMMEARDVLVDGRTDLEYLHELLLCFLALNPKETHKFIISAFTDIVVTLLSAPDKGRRHREIKIRRRHSGCVRRLSMIWFSKNQRTVKRGGAAAGTRKTARTTRGSQKAQNQPVLEVPEEPVRVEEIPVAPVEEKEDVKAEESIITQEKSSPAVEKNPVPVVQKDSDHKSELKLEPNGLRTMNMQVHENGVVKVVWVPPEYGDAVACVCVDGTVSLWEEVVEGIICVLYMWWKLLDFAELKRSSISFFDIEKHETAVSRWSRARTRAAKVGKGLSKDEKARKLALQHWLEAIDPRHRYGHNLQFYYTKWLHCESGQPFFYWLDIGDGKEVNLERCPRPKLHQQCIKYLGPVSSIFPHDPSFMPINSRKRDLLQAYVFHGSQHFTGNGESYGSQHFTGNGES
ncbi:hypothetical protein G4B88_003023 [Cannabis sativa]|uniref:OVATE domain-containing protein n=3 Tax=Cannabis sativa TaxID=3483 RepID=A0A7J6E4C3_CANSA|nr:hypothetical protein G4B88_003023 [Cannabis sativa]